ncbi:Alpha/Beta hydrolase protein [Zopfochytrium polystomum]|nr:Alpha/Beta hydrolase protein [Zopfochytrium polystomum]
MFCGVSSSPTQLLSLYFIFFFFPPKKGRTLERRAYVGSGLNAASVRASLQVYALLAGTAYCSADTLTNWNCKGCTDSRIASTHDVTVVTASSMQGWVGVNENLKTIVVAFRGSSNFDNWLANLNFLKTDLSLPGAPSAVKVHSGFYNVWTAIKPSITPLVNNLKSRYPSYTVSFTGHSLGAAVATFAAIDAKNSGQATASNIVLSTVGEPRIGNTDFSNYVISLNFGVHRRAVNYNDIVPHLPPSSFSFAHRLSEEWIDSASDSVYCDDGSNSGEDTNCANTTPPWVSTSAHLVYDGVTLGGGAC